MANSRKKWKKRGKKCIMLLALLSVLVCMLPGMAVWADGVIPAKKNVYVYDDIGLLLDDQYASLSQLVKERGQEAGCGIYVVITSKTGGRTGDRYLEDFYDQGFDSKQIDVDAVLLFVDMEDRYVNVQAYGKAQNKIPDRICEKIIDAMFDDLHDGYYYDAFCTFVDEVGEYMNYVPIYLRAWVQLLVALIIGGIVVGGMAAHSGGTMTVNAGTYLDQRYSGIRARRDDYIRTTVTKRKKPQESSGGGRGGGSHTSSGGHSHSSAGRHF